MLPELDAAGWLRPQWPAPPSTPTPTPTPTPMTAPRVRALMSTRQSRPSFADADFDPGRDAGSEASRHNRAELERALGAPPRWLRQVHGTSVHVAAPDPVAAANRPEQAREDDAHEPEADAAVTCAAGVVLAVLTADCLPVLLADTQARAVGVAHAGWRGLAAGVVERSVDALRAQAGGDAEVIAWLGPAIGPRAFEVGDDVRHAFCDQDPDAVAAFVPGPREGKWLADLYRLARIRLARVGVTRVSGGDHCTVQERERFYSHRRDRVSGRMASLIWLDSR